MIALMRPIIAAGTYTVMAPATLEQQRRFVREFPERGVLHVAICNETQQLVGMQDVQPLSQSMAAWRHVAEISTFVALEMRRDGIGRRLMEVMLPRARERGFGKLLATIRADNADAVGYYRSQGFDIVGTLRRHACVGGRYLDEILAERLLE
jgi:L-amino acid N-acyltransferase YncA